ITNHISVVTPDQCPWLQMDNDQKHTKGLCS
ncbi:hypothetical protein scyTo_0008203, partial [Scyliorhinus torazame]|nr:hypothetical protein [Scyliorhinus torazame]